jgi:hypothetical protein
MSLLTQKFNGIYILSFIAFVWVVTNVNADTQYSDLPPPPTKPEKFTSKQQLKEYLVKLHEYYAIIGRPRFGKRSYFQDFLSNEQEDISNELYQELIPTSEDIKILDQNQNGIISKQELTKFINLFSKQKL